MFYDLARVPFIRSILHVGRTIGLVFSVLVSMATYLVHLREKIHQIELRM